MAFPSGQIILHHVVDLETAAQKFSKLVVDNGFICIVDLIEEDGTFHKDDSDFNGHNGFSTEYSDIFYKDIKIVEGKDFEYALFILIMKKDH